MSACRYALYAISTGEIISVGTSQDEETAKLHLRNGCDLVIGVNENIKPQTHYYDGGVFIPIPPKKDEGSVFNYETKTWDVDSEMLRSQAIFKRDSLLISTDWTQLPDVPEVTRKLWVEYRQSLRDITNQAGFPISIVWPSKPS